MKDVGAPREIDAATHEEAFVNRFIVKDHRERLLFELQMRHTPSRKVERRGRFLGRFSHGALKYLDSRFLTVLEPPNSDPAVILDILNREGAAQLCYSISTADAIDGRILPLREALKVAVGFGMPSIVSCLPGRLAYLETEQEIGPPGRYILSRS